MLLLRLDGDKLDRALSVRSLSANALAKRLIIHHRPSSRTITGWLAGEEVSPRWRQAIILYFKAGDYVFLGDGSLSKAAISTHNMNRETLSHVTTIEHVTRAAVTAWRNGGGIEPSKLKALAAFLGVTPYSLLDDECRNEILELVNPT